MAAKGRGLVDLDDGLVVGIAAVAKWSIVELDGVVFGRCVAEVGKSLLESAKSLCLGVS